MRSVECPACHLVVEAANDEALFTLARAHADSVHADQNLSDEQVRQIVTQSAKDA